VRARLGCASAQVRCGPSACGERRHSAIRHSIAVRAWIEQAVVVRVYAARFARDVIARRSCTPQCQPLVVMQSQRCVCGVAAAGAMETVVVIGRICATTSVGFATVSGLMNRNVIKRGMAVCFVVGSMLACSDPVRPSTDASRSDVTLTDAFVRDVSDAMIACEGGSSAMCDGVCVDLSRNAQHCGSCGRSCGDGGVCSMGVCAAICGLAGLPCCVGNVCEEGTQCTGGTCVANRGPQPTGRDLVSAGGVMSSPGWVLKGTMGQSSQHVGPMRSTNFVLRGGVIGVIGGP
jgi:hypothetical protein